MKNRIKKHVKIRAGDLIPHELNPRTHSKAQRQALAALYEEIGFARSVLAYELPDGRLKLIDGHLRQSMDPDAEVDVEVLDVNDHEARALLLAIDPLAQLAGYDSATLDHLRQITEKDSAAVAQLWQAVTEAQAAVEHAMKSARNAAAAKPLPEQYMIIIECSSEQEQVALLRRFQKEGITCQAKVA